MPTKFTRALYLLNPKPVNEGYETAQVLANDNISGADSTRNDISFTGELNPLNPKPVNEGYEKPHILTNDNISGVNSNNNEDGSAGEKSIRNESPDFVLYNKEKPDAGVYEYIYDRTAPRAIEPDPSKEKKTQRMAGFADLAMLLSDGVTAAAGGIVNKRNTTATGVHNRSAEAIRERYRQQKEKYDAGLLAAKYNDLQDKRKREDYLDKLRQDKILRDERYQQDRDLVKERERANINLYREQNKMREGLERTKGDIRAEVAAAKPGGKPTTEEPVSYRPDLDIYDQYGILQSLYQDQVNKFEEAKKKNRKAVSSQYVTIAEPAATTKAEIEAYVGMHRRHIKPILDQMEAEAKAKAEAEAEAKNSPKTDRLELGLDLDNTNNNPLGF